jgi:WYL domain
MIASKPSITVESINAVSAAILGTGPKVPYPIYKAHVPQFVTKAGEIVGITIPNFEIESSEPEAQTASADTLEPFDITDLMPELKGDFKPDEENIPEEETSPEKQQIEAAIQNKGRLLISYFGGSEPGEVREVSPIKMTQSHGETYVRVFCHKRNSERTLKLRRLEIIPDAPSA